MSTSLKRGLVSVVGIAALAGVAVFSYAQTHVQRPMHGSPAATKPILAAASGKAAPVNACALLTPDEVSAAVGSKVEAGQQRDDGEVGGKGDYASVGTYSSTCFWRFSDMTDINPDLPMSGQRFVILNAMVWPAGSGEAGRFLESFRDAFKHELIPSDPIAEDIGDEALWWGDGTAVRKGDKSFGVSVFLQNGDKPSQRKMEETLARTIVKRL